MDNNNHISLDDLINETKVNNATEESSKAKTTEVQPDKNPDQVNNTEQKQENPINLYKTAPVNNAETKEVEIKDFAKFKNNEELGEKNMKRMMGELHSQMQAAFKRRWQPALDEIKAAKEEYDMRRAAGEKDPEIKLHYDNSLDLDPNYSDKDIEKIREEEKAKKFEDEHVFNTNEESFFESDKNSPTLDIEKEFDELENQNNKEDVVIENNIVNELKNEENAKVQETPKAEVKPEPVKEEVKPTTVEAEVVSKGDIYPDPSEVISLTDMQDAPKVESPKTESKASITEVKTNTLDEMEDDFDDDLSQLEEDLDLDELEEEKRKAREAKEEKENEALLEEFRKELASKLVVKPKKVDFSKFTIVKHNKPLNKVLTPDKDTYQTWGLFTTGQSIAVSPLSAIEIDEINPFSGTKNDIARQKAIFNTIYKHIAPQCRSNNLENWLRRISFQDINNLYFAIYVACFGKANIVPYQCDKCKHMFTKEPKIMDMVKLGDDEKNKKRFDEIIKKDYSAPSAIEESLLQVNDNFVFGIVPPSLYNYQFEAAFLDKEFVDKYAGIIAIASCVETIYSIDMENETLTPVAIRVDKNDIVKSYKYKILTLYKILKQLTSNEFHTLDKSLRDINEEINNRIDISYQLPETTCPKCGNKIESTPMDAISLVFTRQQLIHMLD